MNTLSKESEGLEPFKIADRVDHTQFGFGTVVKPQQGDQVEVLFDILTQRVSKVRRRYLRLVTSPEAKGGPFWAQRYIVLLKETLDERARTDMIMELSFRSHSETVFDAARIRAALEYEKLSVQALLNFLDEDEAEKHH